MSSNKSSRGLWLPDHTPPVLLNQHFGRQRPRFPDGSPAQVQGALSADADPGPASIQLLLHLYFFI